MQAHGRNLALVALLTSLGGGCGSGDSPTAPIPATPTPVPTTATPVAGTIVETFRGRVAATGGTEDSTHVFTMTGFGIAEARLSDISPATSRLRITLCQGNIIATGTCGPLAMAEGTDPAQLRLGVGTNSVFVAKAQGDAFREPSFYTLTLIRPR